MKHNSLIKLFLLVTLMVLLMGFVSSETVESNDTSQVINTQDSTNHIVTQEQSNMINKRNVIESSKKSSSGPIETKIQVDDIGTTSFTDNVNITGKYMDITGRNLIKTPLTLNINGKSVITKTDTNGNFNYSYKTNTLGKNNISISYWGNSNFAATATKISFNVIPQTTKITLNPINDTEFNDVVRITGKYTDKNGVNLTWTPLVVNYNGVKYSTKTDGRGNFVFTFKTSVVGLNNVTVSYPGNKRYYGAEAKSSFNVLQRSTKIIFNPIENTEFNDFVSISGKYIDKTGLNLTWTPLEVNLNGVKYTTKTNSTGGFDFEIKASTVGLNNVTVSYPGNKRYRGAKANTSFEVLKRSTKITLNPINDVEVNDTVVISGKYTDKEGMLLTKTPLDIKINGVKYSTKTDDQGEFVFRAKAKKSGEKNVSISYPGNKRFAGTTTNSTFNVLQGTIIYINPINDTEYSKNVTISGQYMAKDGLRLTLTPLNVIINGFKYTTKTDANGDFVFSIKTSIVGKNTVSISYHGNKRFAATTTNTVFYVTGESDTISIDTIPITQYTDTVSITGKYLDNTGREVFNRPLIININGKSFSTKTDANGVYVLNYTTNTLGQNNVTVSYYGDEKYPQLSNNASFTVTKKDTKLSVEPIQNTTIGKQITIKGKYTDSSGNPLKLTTVSLLINDVGFSAKTNENGTFQCNYETFVIGTNTVEIYYKGTERYSGTSLNTTFNVTSSTSGRLFKTRKTMVASVFVSGTVDNSHVTKWVNSGITDVYVRASEYDNDTRTLRKTISLCKDTNIKVHAWVIVFRDNGKWDNSIATQNKMKKFISGLMDINGVEGICLDYIRYSGANPKIVNTSFITNYVRDINYMAKQVDQRMEISACIMPEITDLKYYYGQDMKAMEKYVDYMIVMAYKNNFYKDTSWMVDVTKLAIKQTKHAKVVTSLTTYSDMYGRVYLPLKEITDDIHAVMNAGSYGYSLFSKSTTPVYPKIF